MVTTTTTSGISRLLSALTLTPAAHALRQAVIAKQQAVAWTLWPSATVSAIGSYVVGSALPASDLDLVISLPADQWLPDIVRSVSSSPAWATRLQAANEAAALAVPNSSRRSTVNHTCLLRYISNGSSGGAPEAGSSETDHGELASDGRDSNPAGSGPGGVQVDVTFQPLAPMRARDEFMVAQLDRVPAARETLRLLKAWTCYHGFAEPYAGGIGNYGLTLSLIACTNRLGLSPDRTAAAAAVMTPFDLLCAYIAWFTDRSGPAYGGVLDVRTGLLTDVPPPNPRPLGRTTAPASAKSRGTPAFEGHVSYIMLQDPVVPSHIVGQCGFRRYEFWDQLEALLDEMRRSGPDMEYGRACELFAGGDVEAAGLKRRQVIRDAMKTRLRELKAARRKEAAVLAEAALLAEAAFGSGNDNTGSSSIGSVKAKSRLVGDHTVEKIINIKHSGC